MVPYTRGAEISRSWSAIVDEAKALVKYVTERGLDNEAQLCNAVATAVTAFESTPADKKAMALLEVRNHYANLVKLTYATRSVNGKTIIQSRKWNVIKQMAWILVLGISFFTLAILTEILDAYFGDIPAPPDESTLGSLYWVHSYMLVFLSPFFWGGLGACVYLVKHLSDRAAQQTFDLDQFKGHHSRIWLGAILGSVVQYIYEPSSFGSSGVNLDGNAIAFFTGLGVKVVFGALQKTIDSIATILNLNSPKNSKMQSKEEPAKPMAESINRPTTLSMGSKQ